MRLLALQHTLQFAVFVVTIFFWKTKLKITRKSRLRAYSNRVYWRYVSASNSLARKLTGIKRFVVHALDEKRI
jgi:hypothetical protein